MGKGTIQSHLGEGQYSVQLHFHKERVQQRIDWLTDEIEKIDSGGLQTLEDDLTEAQAAVDAVAADLNGEIEVLAAMEFWQSETAYSAGQKVRIGARQYMVCEIGGVSGQGDFEFPTSDGQVVREDFVQWQPYRPDSEAFWDRKTWQSNTQFQAGDFVSTGTYEARVVKAGRSGVNNPPWPNPNSFPYPSPYEENDTTTGPTVDDIAIAWRGVNVDDEITRLSMELAKAAGEREIATVKRDALKLRRTSLEKQKEYLESNTPEDPVIEAWCADLTLDLSGEVAIAEIPGERHQLTPLIRPGYDGAAVHDPARDGQLQPSIAGTAGGVFANWALRAAWQKWKPTYRLGTITALEGDTCDVALDEALSSDQDLPLNQTDILGEVPIVYMQCNGGAFAVDDRVVVEFINQDWEQPRVIGFEKNPKACNWPAVFAHDWYIARQAATQEQWDPVWLATNDNTLVVEYRLGRGGSWIPLNRRTVTTNWVQYHNGPADADTFDQKAPYVFINKSYSSGGADLSQTIEIQPDDVEGNPKGIQQYRVLIGEAAIMMFTLDYDIHPWDPAKTSVPIADELLGESNAIEEIPL